MFHLTDRLLLDVSGKPLISPVLTHLCMEEILIDRCQLFTKSRIQFLQNFRITFHGKNGSTACRSQSSCGEKHATVFPTRRDRNLRERLEKANVSRSTAGVPC